MAEKCYKAQEIDLALFLIEPHGSDWQEFRAHYPHCATCSAEIQKWTSLEHSLRSMGNSSAALHPSAEALIQFQQRSYLLPAEERSKIDVHLRSCAACREEVKLLGSFDPALIQQWTTEIQPNVTADTHASWIGHAWHSLRSLFLHPAFAYGLVLLLSVPFIRSYYSSSFTKAPISSDVAPTSAPVPELARPEVKRETGVRIEERQTLQPPPPLSASEPAPIWRPAQQESSAASEQETMKKAKEDTPPAKLAKQSARQENFALKDERVPEPLPPPASPATSLPMGAGARDVEVPAQQKSRPMGEKERQVHPKTPAPTIAAEGRIGSTEMLSARKREVEEEDSARASAASTAPPQTAALARSDLVRRYNSTQAALVPLTDTYKDAYESRDLNTLDHVWVMDQSWSKALRQLFAKSQRITLSLDFDEGRSTISTDQQIIVPLVQSITAVDQDGQTSTYGPFFCLADIRQQSTSMWKIHELQEDPQHPGRCRLQQ